MSKDNKGAGWLFFAGTVLGIAGIMRFFDALWAFGIHGSAPTKIQGSVLGDSFKTYGWVYLIVSIVLLGASFGILTGSQFSRWLGIITGGILAVSAIWWIPYYPAWSLTYITIGILVIYALAKYGSRETVEGLETYYAPGAARDRRS